MKLKNTSKIIKHVARTALCLLLCISAVVVPFCYHISFADEKAMGMEWTRVKSVEELRKHCTKGQQEYDLNTKNFWTNVLIVYQSGNNYYYLENNCVDDEKLQASRVTKVSGIKPELDSFTTRNRANTPSLKFTSDDYVAIRFNDSKGELTNSYIRTNIEWYGVRWHACHEAGFTNSASGYEGFWACSHDVFADHKLQDRSDGTIRIRWMSNHSACTDRSWNWSGSKVDVSIGAHETYGFMFFVGTPAAINILEVNMDRDPYSSVVMANYTVPSNVEITVPTGATLVFVGENHNCGHIYVDGGTLVIAGSLDADYGGADGYQNGRSFHPSDIDLVNGGKLIIEKEGGLYHRNRTSGVTLSSGSSAYISGVMMVANKLVIGDNCTLRAMPQSFIAIGVRPNTDHDIENLSAAYLQANKNVYLDQLVSWDTAWWESSSDTGGLFLQSNSSLYSEGGIFVKSSYSFSVPGNARFYGKVSTNEYASIGSMMP